MVHIGVEDVEELEEKEEVKEEKDDEEKDVPFEGTSSMRQKHSRLQIWEAFDRKRRS